MAAVISPLDARGIVAPLLPSLPSAAIASEPATAVLPLLSPILRQRVQFLSASSSEPWIRLLSYDSAKAARLVEVARSARLEPHPVSGEVEIDWDSHGHSGGDVEIRYRRLDVETLQALVLLRDLDLVFRLVYCETDSEGSGGWRVGEVSIPDVPDAFATFGGSRSVADAEEAFHGGQADTHRGSHAHTVHSHANADDGHESDNDDDYWALYDATPGRTPAVKRSPAPEMPRSAAAEAAADDAYFAQYDDVQPAMDNHDPDGAEAVEAVAPTVCVAPVVPAAPVDVPVAALPFGMGQPMAAQTLERAVGGSSGPDADAAIDQERLAKLVHPRPASASSQSSSGVSGVLVAKLEQSAGKQEQSEFGVKQHVSRSIKSLFLLSRAAGIDREEFEQLVKTELDMLAMMEE